MFLQKQIKLCKFYFAVLFQRFLQWVLRYYLLGPSPKG